MRWWWETYWINIVETEPPELPIRDMVQCDSMLLLNTSVNRLQDHTKSFILMLQKENICFLSSNLFRHGFKTNQVLVFIRVLLRKPR